MQESDDSILLRSFVENNSEDAFAAIVARHVNLVYSVALRHVDHPHQAEEITQAVFIVLARKAGELRHASALSSWLFQTTRLTATNFMRSEIRRVQREQEAHVQSNLSGSEPEIWAQVAPLLDVAVASLGEKDRRAIVLRFYENKNLHDVGAALGASEDAAFQRVNRAVEKMRKFLLKRGVACSSVALAGAVSAYSVQAAPAGLTASTTGAALHGSGLPATMLSQATLKMMAWAKLKLVLGVLVGAIVIGGIVGVTRSSDPHRETTPNLILKRCEQTYASLLTYSETLKTVTQTAALMKGKNSGGNSASTMSVKLGRPNMYRLEEISGPPWAMWTSGNGEFWMLLQNNFYRTNNEELGSELVFLPPIGLIPSAFFQKEDRNALKALALAGDLVKTADEPVNDIDCYKLTGSPRLKVFPKMKLTLWIGKQDFLIHRAQAVMVVNARVTNAVVQTHENISVNQPLAKDQFIHPLPTGAKPINSFPFSGKSP